MLLETFTFYPIFTSFHSGLDEVCYISNKYQPLDNLAKHLYFYTRDFISLYNFGKKLEALHRKTFSEHPLFSTFSLFLKVDEVCNVSSNCWLPNKPANKIFLYKAPYTPPLFQKNFCSSSQMLLKTSTFYYIFTSFDSGWSVLCFKSIPTSE